MTGNTLPVVPVRRSRMSSISLIFACGTALFSDGYANGVMGNVNTILTRVYGKAALAKSNYSIVLTSVGFAGTIVGMLVFGVLSDKIGRKFGMMLAAGIVAFFSALSSVSIGAHHSVSGMLFFLGIGVGAEWPCGSVAASEQSEDPSIDRNTQHRWFVLATNIMNDLGFALSSFVPLVLFWVCGENHLRAVWRLSLGLGTVPAVGVFIWRWNMEEPVRYKESSMKRTQIPYKLVVRRYWRGVLALSAVWFIYDFITITGGNQSLTVVLGWTVIINLFYVPGAIGGAFIVDYLGPKGTMIFGLVSQALIGFIMSGLYTQLRQHVSAFAVMYGIFLALGEVGPGNCLSLLAVKSGPTAVRGQYHGLAASIGKIGAFAGDWVFPALIKRVGGAESINGNIIPFLFGSALALVSAIIMFCFIKPLDHDGMVLEDMKFRAYLEANGYDTSQMGLASETATIVSDGSAEKVDDRTGAAV
ncbi:hypothetical protein PLICRDRAFT_48080 [Plicaturopsis crispa FD-325 SS-3]|nr:hypothetical protein PLICRDRAFT_48080 [Plicaturopsis crispa FD-325 SS-3]